MTPTPPPASFPAAYVDVAWLMRHGDDAALVVLDASIDRRVDADGKGIYASGEKLFRDEGHIPAARFADLFSVFSDPAAPYPFTKPDVAALQAVLRAFGVHAASKIVVYDRLNGIWAARVWWLLKAYGLADVAVLDGGLRQWRAAGGALGFGAHAGGTQGMPSACDLVLAEKPGYFVDLRDVLDIVAGRTPEPKKMFCALRPSDFSGEDSTATRRGHIPRSGNLPYPAALNDAGLFDPARLRAQVDAAQVGTDDALVLYCGGGIAACGLALGLVALGFDTAHIGVYDGSLTEWRADPERPMALGL